ncbi:phosphoethanolamine transferase [Ectothiorhodospiraceae bacterium 2226]|nr:phosphoethanolamine transferase [Ectothiorhodospiraceae bacterium 2226]
MLVLFGVLLALQPFGAPYAGGLQLVTSAKYTLLLLLWSSLTLLLVSARQGPRAALYCVALGLALYAEARNFQEFSLWAPVAWTTLAVLALVAETALRERLLTSPRSQTWRAAGYTLVQLPLFGVPLAVLAYNGATGATLSDDSLLAIYQTNPGEALAFAREFIPLHYLLLVVGLPVVLYAANRVQVAGETAPRRPAPVFLLALAGSLSVLHLGVVYEKSPLLGMGGATYSDYRAELRAFRAVRAERGERLPEFTASTSGAPRTYLVVIGESHSRHHMSAYGYARPTTPWLDRMRADPGLILFGNAYANHPHTMPALTLALTEASQYNEQDYVNSASLVDIAKAAGFTTTWISNQVAYGSWDNQVTAIAEYADRQYRLNRHVGQTTRTTHFDEATVPQLARALETLDPQAHNLIVVHLMGSHWIYCNRFPRDGDSPYAAFVPGDWAQEERLDCYDHSVRYNDYVMRALYETARGFENFAGLVYFPDHGESVESGLGHYVGNFRYEMMHIPLYAWFSEDYRAQRPERVARLRARAARPFTNDIMYDTLLGIMGIETPHYRAGHDLGAPEYGIAKDALLTLHGERRVLDDPWIRKGVRDGVPETGGMRRVTHR